MSEVKIHFDNVSKCFGKNIVLDKVNITIESGTSLVIIGGSGSGKSVLLKCLLGLLRPEKGNIYIDEQQIVGLRLGERAVVNKKIGVLFQGSALFDSLPVWENVAFGLINGYNVKRSIAYDIAIEKLSLVGLGANVGQLSPSVLSGGMKKRVALARAIATDPEIILLDEPTTGLDPIMSDVINNLIIECGRKLNATMLTITHDMVSAHKIADHIAMIYRGNIIWHGKAKDMNNSGNPYVDQFINGRAEGPITMDLLRK